MENIAFERIQEPPKDGQRYVKLDGNWVALDETAYRSAVLAGYTGTEQEWLNSQLVGSNISIDDTNLNYNASNVQQALESEQNRVLYGGNY